MKFAVPTAADTDALHALFAGALPGCWTHEGLRAELEAPHTRVLWAPGECAAIGTVVLDQAELLLIAVRAELRGRGLGSALLSALELEFARAGAESVWLEVREGNPALHLYLRAGYREVDRRRGYYRDGGDAILMTRVLSPRPL